MECYLKLFEQFFIVAVDVFLKKFLMETASTGDLYFFKCPLSVEMGRDWTNANINRLEIYADRMEITSFGGLPNTLTLEKIKAGNSPMKIPTCYTSLKGLFI